MIKEKKCRTCKNCHLLEGGFSESYRCVLDFPIERTKTLPYTPEPLVPCYKVTTTKDYMTIIRDIDLYKFV